MSLGDDHDDEDNCKAPRADMMCFFFSISNLMYIGRAGVTKMCVIQKREQNGKGRQNAMDVDVRTISMSKFDSVKLPGHTT